MVEEITNNDPYEELAGTNIVQNDTSENLHAKLTEAQKNAKYAQFCEKQLPCGHPCKGVIGEQDCFPCVVPACHEVDAGEEPVQPQDMQGDADAEGLINATQDDVCALCHVTSLPALPCVGLVCRHAYHADCLHNRIENGQKTKRITFDYLGCPICKKMIEFNPRQVPAELSHLLDNKKSTKLETQEIINQICKQDGTQEIQMTFYNCFKCQKVYCGGKNDYEGAVRENMDQQNFLCLKCTEVELGYGKEVCAKHGNEFTDYKCVHCCSIALFVIDNGKRFFCQPCFNDHMEKRESIKTQCTGGVDCVLQISAHPKAPTKFPMGCSLCRSEKLEILVKETGSAGFNIEQRGDLMRKHGHIDVAVKDRMPVISGEQKKAVAATAKADGARKTKGCTIF